MAAHSISASAGNHATDVPVGAEVMISEEEDGLDDLLKTDLIARRNVRRIKLADGAAVMSSEVSVVSIIQQSILLNRLFNSLSDDDKAVSSKIAKTAVALSVVTGKHGVFTTVKP